MLGGDVSVLGGDGEKDTLSLSESPGNEAFYARNIIVDPSLRLRIALRFIDSRMRGRQLDSIHAYHKLSWMSMLTNRSRDPVQHSYLCSTRLLPPNINRTYTYR